MPEDAVESYVCDICGTEVRADRVLVLTKGGQIGRHPDCHTFKKAMR